MEINTLFDRTDCLIVKNEKNTCKLDFNFLLTCLERKPHSEQ